jgi:hypothetical protein
MKIMKESRNLRDNLMRHALAFGVVIGLGAGCVHGATTTATYNFGLQDAGTTLQVVSYPAGIGNLLLWIEMGSLPVGSILREVSATVRLDAIPAPASDSWTSDLLIYFDSAPATPGTAALLQIGGDYSGAVGTVGQMVGWDGGDGGPGTTINQTLTAGVDWTGDIDLNAVRLSFGNNYDVASWSGTVTVTYDIPEPGTMVIFGLLAIGMSLTRTRRSLA